MKDAYKEAGVDVRAGYESVALIKKHIQSIDFKNSSPKYPEKKKDFQKLADNMKETDNPVLVLVRLKD